MVGKRTVSQQTPKLRAPLSHFLALCSLGQLTRASVSFFTFQTGAIHLIWESCLEITWVRTCHALRTVTGSPSTRQLRAVSLSNHFLNARPCFILLQHLPRVKWPDLSTALSTQTEALRIVCCPLPGAQPGPSAEELLTECGRINAVSQVLLLLLLFNLFLSIYRQ